jgi:hypothetical protein
MKPGDCKRFDFCSCPVCPLDPHWSRCRHLKGEPVCLWLRERAKVGGEHAIRGSLPADQAAAVETVFQLVWLRRNPLSRALSRAADTGSKLASGRSLRAQRGRP